MFSEESELEVNKRRTKVRVFRKRWGIRKEKWKYNGRELEVVNEYKYLGFWCTTRNLWSTLIVCR